MPLTNIRREVQGMLVKVEVRLADAERRLAKGTLREQVTAAGELSFLRHQKQTLEDRMKALDASPQGASETAFQWLREDWFNLMLRLDAWLSGG